MAYDVGLDLFYIGVGNGSPGTARCAAGGGDNLYLSSIVAIDLDDGSRLFTPATRGDTWDYTATQHNILADVEIAMRCAR